MAVNSEDIYASVEELIRDMHRWANDPDGMPELYTKRFVLKREANAVTLLIRLPNEELQDGG